MLLKVIVLLRYFNLTQCSLKLRYLCSTYFYADNNTVCEVDMKNAKRMTVVHYRIKGKPKRNIG